MATSKKISISQRLCPYSHLPGTACLIPGTPWQLLAFPTLLKFSNLQTGETEEEPLPWIGPVKNFTVHQDLERGEVVITGKTAEGHRRHVVKRGSLPSHIERLSLGSHKALDWELVKRRCDLADILPVWFRLGQMVPSGGKIFFPPPEDKLEAAPFLENIFSAYFHGIMVPRLVDEDHQGIFFEGKSMATAPLALLTEGFRWIRSLFFKKIPKASLCFRAFLPSSMPGGSSICARRAGIKSISNGRKNFCAVSSFKRGKAGKFLCTCKKLLNLTASATA